MTLARELRVLYQNDKRLTNLLSDLTIRLYPESASCLICERKTNLLKTDRKICYSFNLGKFTLICGSNFCAVHKYYSDKLNQVIRVESNLAAMTVDKGFRVTFDLVVKVGRLRYEDHRQLHEIQSYLKCSPARIELPISTLGLIAKRFLTFCRALNLSQTDSIRDDIKGNGGYFLHFDGSTEQKCGQCSLILIDSRSGHVLESAMVVSESVDILKEALGKVHAKYGNPLAVISDLRPGFVSVCIAVFGKDVKHVLCHYHFLRTFKKEFNQNHQFIKTCMTQKWQLQAGLSKQLKGLAALKMQVDYSRELKELDKIQAYWKLTTDTLGTYYYTLRWILNYKQDSSGRGAPFDLPLLDLYHRLLASKELIERIFAKASSDVREKYYRQGFCCVLEKTKNLGYHEVGFRKALNQLEYARKWFNKLRAVLFLASQTEDDKVLAPLSKHYALTREEAKKIPQRLDGFLQLVKRERHRCKQPVRVAFLENLIAQVEKYSANLHVPELSVTIDAKEIILVCPRTNNYIERLFRLIKSLLRRCSGRSKLPKEFGSVGALLPYYLTMREHPIFSDIFSNDCRLSEEFARLFDKSWQPPKNVILLLQKPENIVNERKHAVLGG